MIFNKPKHKSGAYIDAFRILWFTPELDKLARERRVEHVDALWSYSADPFSHLRKVVRKQKVRLKRLMYAYRKFARVWVCFSNQLNPSLVF